MIYIKLCQKIKYESKKKIIIFLKPIHKILIG